MDTVFEWFLWILLGIMVIGVILGLGVSSYYFHKVWNAKTPQDLKIACTVDWYKNDKLDSLPAQCRQFYNQGITLPDKP